ncbi:DRTGG domain-containing protein [Desulfosporosinus sp. BICA1-9]|uniref:DRTGG domain-containing protein n=1 Tax=Desulfosporosinus sp. BICA1-9 TaxID=1531958 RepID=UPI00054B6021|nr:DRTGG domain-containing protein [Desulfosporosinus sp. BICA1-9]KJS50924.1 MAG: transcriptional regulator [Peptococcaceae bacterium BRH_c23]KJS79487.1 MAG: transcriptional regulator [Desulfosporosinus sp. BICA1-9]HBW35445.1 CBS domain-containing protein [Desulfosporosinus sp.]
MTKHQQILTFIKRLAIGSKVSVRFIAKELDVSEGTAYRAIKEAEAKGFVRSIPKVGTIRIEGVKERQIEDLTLREVSQIAEGVVICGFDYLDRSPNKFLIAAMEIDSMDRFLEDGALCIVGNRQDVQMYVLKHNASLLITGGLEPDEEVVALARQNQLVIIQSPYDTFSVTTMINRALYDRLIQKELILVEDIMVKDVSYLTVDATVDDWRKLSQTTDHSRFPVVDNDMMLTGIVSALDVAGADVKTRIVDVMSTNPFLVGRDDPVTHISRIMVWEGWEIAVVADQGKLIGILSLQDVIEAYQQVQKQPQFGETVDNLVLSGFRYVDDAEHLTIEGEITNAMVNDYGSASCGVIVTVMNMAGYIGLRKKYRLDAITENFTLYQLQPIAVGTEIKVTAKLLLVAKRHCNIEVEVTVKDAVVAKGLMTARIGDKKLVG